MLSTVALVSHAVLALVPLPGKLARPDVHGDPLPNGAVARLGTVRYRLGTDALLVAHLPGGKSVLTVNADLTAHVWEPATGTALLRFDASGGAGRGGGLSHPPVALGADGKTLAVMGGDGAVRLFDPTTGKERVKLDTKADNPSFYRLALSADGKTLALSSVGGAAVIWDVAGRKEVGALAAQDPALNTQGLEFTRDGKQLLQAATGGPNTGGSLVVVWDVETRKEQRRLTDLHRPGGGSITRAVYSPDGALLALPAGNGVRLIGLADGKEVRTLREEGRRADLGETAVFTADGKRIVALVRGHTPIVFEVATGKVVARAGPGDAPPAPREQFGRNLAASPDGKTAAVAVKGVLRVTDLESGKEAERRAGHSAAVTELAFADGKTVVTLDRNDARAWEFGTGKELRRVEVPVSRLLTLPDPACLSSDGTRLVVGRASGWRLLDTGTGKEVRAFRRTGVRVRTDHHALSPDGKTLAAFDTTDLGGTVLLIDTVTGDIRHKLKLPGKQEISSRTFHRAVAFSPEGMRLAVPHQDGAVAVYEADSGREWRKLEPGKGRYARRTAFGPDGKGLALDFTDGTVAVYDLETGRITATMGEKKEVGWGAANSQTLAWSPDGTLLARAEGASVRLYDPRTGKRKGELVGHGGEVLVVAFSPDGRWLASGSLDTTALVWDLRRFLEKPNP